MAQSKPDLDLKTFYPHLFKPATPYVYFNDLDDEIINEVAGYFSKDLKDFKDSNKTDLSSIDAAFQFLENIIRAERAKENSFIQYLKTKTKATINIEIPSLDSNWNDFVREIQRVLSVGGPQLQNLQIELTRLQKNQEAYKKAQQNGGRAWYTQDVLTKTSQQLIKMLQELRSGEFNKNNNTGKLILSIITQFGTELLDIKDNTLVFKRQELLTLIFVISQIITQKYYQMQEYIKNPLPSDTISTKQIEIDQIVDNETQTQILELINNFKTLPAFREQLIKNYHFPNPQNPNKGVIKKSITINNIQEEVEELFKLFKGYEIPEKAFQIIQVNNSFAELTSSIKFALSGAIAVKNTGSKQAKPDNIIGYIAIDKEALDPTNDGQIKAKIQAIERIQKEIEELVKSLSQANDKDYYEKQFNKWQDATENLNSMLKQLKEDYNFLADCYLIEDSTKNYLSLYAREEDGKISNAVHGGSLGAKLDDQLNKIEVLTQAGGITMIDKQWLIAAIINSGPDMIANKQKISLENYLAMFAAILLFDSQINIAQEGLAESLQKISGSSVHQIHLFSVNNGYYPLSYVLKLTKDSLTKAFFETQQEVESGVQTEIYGYVNKPKKSYELDAWNNTRDSALKSTKIKMKFLVNFMNVLNNLLQGI